MIRIVTVRDRADILGCARCGQLRFAQASQRVPAWQTFECARPFDHDTVAGLAHDASLRALALELVRVVDRKFDVDLTTSRDVVRDPHGPDIDAGTGRTIRVFGDDERGLIETNGFEMHGTGEACCEVIVIRTYGARDLELSCATSGPT